VCAVLYSIGKDRSENYAKAPRDGDMSLVACRSIHPMRCPLTSKLRGSLSAMHSAEQRGARHERYSSDQPNPTQLEQVEEQGPATAAAAAAEMNESIVCK
jgi:hypothetical protein